jgi:hypothetical protein
MDATNLSTPSIGRIQTLGIAAAVVGAVLLAAGAFLAGGGHPVTTFYRAYIYGWSFWNGVAIAALGILLLHHVVGGNWGFVSRRILEAGAMSIPVMMLFFIPVLLPPGMHALYEWSHENAKDDPILSQKFWWLNYGFYLARYVVYFLIFSGYAFVLNAKSTTLDTDPRYEHVKKVKSISSVGILVYVITITFYYVDVLMSLTPHWYSTIFGILMMVGQALAMFSICAILLSAWQGFAPFSGVVTRQHFHDIGNLMLAFTMLWTYMAFSQYLITWSGNLPEEAQWYEPRIEDGWRVVSALIMLFHFFVPFLLLLQRPIKRRGPALALVALAIIVMRHVDLLWILQPSFEAQDAHGAAGIHSSPLIYVAYLGSTLAFAGVFFFLLGMFAARKPLLPLFRSHVEPKLIPATEAVRHG